MTTADSELVVTVTATIMDGTVVRWYGSLAAADHGGEMLSASRNGVIASGYLHEIPPAAMAQAGEVHERLAGDRDAAFRHLATHRQSGLSGPLEPVDPEKGERP